jgi:hypothetical protein
MKVILIITLKFFNIRWLSRKTPNFNISFKQFQLQIYFEEKIWINLLNLGEQGAEENIWTQEKGSNSKIEKIT